MEFHTVCLEHCKAIACHGWTVKNTAKVLLTLLLSLYPFLSLSLSFSFFHSLAFSVPPSIYVSPPSPPPTPSGTRAQISGHMSPSSWHHRVLDQSVGLQPSLRVTQRAVRADKLINCCHPAPSGHHLPSFSHNTVRLRNAKYLFLHNHISFRRGITLELH